MRFGKALLHLDSSAKVVTRLRVATRSGKDLSQRVACYCVTGIGRQRLVVALDGLVEGSALVMFTSVYQQSLNGIAPRAALRDHDRLGQLWRARMTGRQSQHQCLGQLINELRVNTLLEQSPLEGVGERGTLENIQSKR